MTQNPGVPGLSDIDMLIATNTALRAQNYVQEASVLAETAGGEVTLHQLIAAVLASGWDLTATPISREEFSSVYDHVQYMQQHIRDSARIQEAAVSGFGLSGDDGSGEQA